MNSEVHLEILRDETEQVKVKREAVDVKETRIADEASEAVGFEKHPFWQLMKRDLEEVHVGITNRIMNEEYMPKEMSDHLKIKAADIKLFTEHPMIYVKRLKNLLTLKKHSR